MPTVSRPHVATWRRSTIRGGLAGILAALAAIAPAHANAAQTGKPADPGAVRTSPATVADLDCATIVVDMSTIGRESVEPGPFDPKTAFRSVMSPDIGKRFERAGRLDPNGLCRYRDENAALGPPTPRRVVFMGDSITENWRFGAPAIFTGDTLDRGISGQKTGQMLARFRQDVIDLRPRVVHIMAGVNDIGDPTGTILTRSNIASMVDLAQANGIRVILGAITPSALFWMTPDLRPAPRIAELNAWLKGFASRRRIAFVDYHTPLADAAQGLRADLGNDGLHPNRDGYASMNPLAKAAIAATFASQPVSSRKVGTETHRKGR